MYRPGHTGVALLVYAPFGYALLRDGHPILAVLGGGIAVALAMVPDLDLRVPGMSHRGVTHTLLFAVCVGVVLGAGGWAIADTLGDASVGLDRGVDMRVGSVSPAEFGSFGFVVGVLAVSSHLLADALTPMGIAPFWPVSSKRYSLGVAKSSNPVANAVLLVLGLCATLGVLWIAGPIG